MMFKTKMMLAAATAASLLAAGAPAFAQGYGGYGYGPPQPVSYGGDRGPGRDLSDRADRLQVWIDSGRDQGWLRGDQAWRLSADLRDVRRQAWQARRDGDPREAGWVNAKLDRIGERLREIREYGRRW